MSHSTGAVGKHLQDLCEATQIQPIAWKLKHTMEKVSVIRITLLFALAVVASYSVAHATEGRSLFSTFHPIKRMVLAVLMVKFFRPCVSPHLIFF